MSESKSSDLVDFKERESREVLPKDVVPTLYTLSLAPDLISHFKFFGRVFINLEVQKECDSITLNAADLYFMKVTVKEKKRASVADASADLDDDATVHSIPISTLEFNKREEVRIPLPGAVTLTPKSAVVLEIEYVGILNDQMKGFYRSKYTRSEGEAAYCGVTQFEATDARRAFPCWDEPSVKAQFRVSLTVARDLVCLSNMAVESEEMHGSSMKTVRFQTTPRMSTYLLAWFVADFGFREARTARGVVVRVWTPVGKESQGEFALEVACKCLDFYEKYFGIDYPLPKCDMIAVPDFAAGAMENWGLITYREIALLADSETASVRSLRYVAIVVCHELAHQWFGNLVTMDWWSQLWLNEGFACFMEYFATDALFPEWNMWDLFVTSEFSSAFELDAMATSHAIELEVKSAAEAEEMFDSISYCKGASVIRMLQSFVGAEVFQRALSNYLKKFEYANAQTSDLWSYLSAESGKKVAEVMKNWTRAQGFPLICCDYSPETGRLSVSQMRHLATGKLTKAQTDVTWQIPLTVKTAGGTQSLLLDAKKKVFELAASGWVHLNADSVGFYAVSYSKPMLSSLLSASAALSTVDKVCLVRDATALAQSCASAHATQNLLNLIVAFKEDSDYPLWDAIVTAAAGIRKIIDRDSGIFSDFSAVMRFALSTVWAKVGWQPVAGEHSDVCSLLRPLLIGALSKYGDLAVIATAKDKFAAFMKATAAERTPALLAPALRSAVYSVALKYGSKAEFELLKAYYLATDSGSEKSWALRALGYTREAALISGLLAWILHSEDVKAQDKVFPFRIVAQSIEGRELAWQFLQKNFDVCYQLFGGGFLVQHLVKIPEAFVSLRKANEIEKFYASKDKAKAKRGMQQCLETIRTFAKWRNEALKQVAKWCADSRKSLPS